MAFEKFERGKVGVSFPAVTITTGGTLGINSVCLQEFQVTADHVELYFDGESRNIGIKPIKDSTDAFTLAKPKVTSKCAYVTAKKFLKYYDISYKEKTLFTASWNPKEHMITIDLNEHFTPLPAGNIGHAKETHKPLKNHDIKL